MRSRRPVRLVSLLLILQAVLFYGISQGEQPPVTPALAALPPELGEWHTSRDNVVEKEVQETLRADDLLNRTYLRSGSQLPHNLFVAYFRSQRTGQAPHSPKNCLPGSGFTPSLNDTVQIAIPNWPAPIEVNRYIVARGGQKSLVMYWYQSRDRVVASEYRAKFYVAVDALRYNRTDTALVRTVVPVLNDDEAAATRASIEFIQAFFLPLRHFFPN